MPNASGFTLHRFLTEKSTGQDELQKKRDRSSFKKSPVPYLNPLYNYSYDRVMSVQSQLGPTECLWKEGEEEEGEENINKDEEMKTELDRELNRIRVLEGDFEK